ncbi:MAG: phosphoenolpyruvate carboxykinase [Candidatus Auribacterota bacterium]|nr:phosphoenolpyruvate carboxykinase [Candidatus Auribacterota bacterium]
MQEAKIVEKKVIIRIKDKICETADDLFESSLFNRIIKKCVGNLQQSKSALLNIFGEQDINDEQIAALTKTLQFLSKMDSSYVMRAVKDSKGFFQDTHLFYDFVEYLYNYWRSYDRFIICNSEGDILDKRPYRTFNDTVERLTHLIRKVYRDIEENLTGNHPRIYRQLRAGAEIATIALPKDIAFPEIYQKKLQRIPIIRQVLLNPPLVLDPPMNKRTGRFEKTDKNPLEVFDIAEDEYLCYPAKVGPLLILIYFHERIFGLGFSLSNLFELAEDNDLTKKPDAVYIYGAPEGSLDSLASFPTVFYDDEKNDMIVAAVPRDNHFGYFGYLKKMVLTLHNIKMMKLNKMPFHGALIKFNLGKNKERVVLIIGDTGAGKSETLEAFRTLDDSNIRDMIVIADDMGSLDIDDNGNVIGYGTEIGAFLRLDDLQPGYAFGQIDRAIFMSPSKTNARLVIPITTFDNVIKGHKIDCVLYANNYEEIDDDHPILEQFSNATDAIKVFKDGAVMSKGTTTSTGLVHSYFANIFGPPQYREIHSAIAQRFFDAFFKNNMFIGQMRTRLGIAGFEYKGPSEAAKELLNLLLSI